MRVALVILHADPARGGAERYTADLAAALAARGHAVTVLASGFGPPIDGVAFAPLEHRGATRRAKYLCFLRALDAHLAATGYDVVHAMLPVRRCDVYHPHAGLAAEAVASGHLKHAPGARRAAARWANRFNRKRQAFADVERAMLDAGGDAPLVLCLSEYVKTTVRRHFPELGASRLATLFNAVDLRRFDPAREAGAGDVVRERLGLPDGTTVALMIAQDFARKGLREAILALARIDEPALALVVVGRPDPSAYRRLARECGVEDRVIFAGPTPDAYGYYRAADFFVLPTRHDPCSLVVLEALAMGVPVISTKFNGACEVMAPGGRHGAVLDDPADVAALADAMRGMRSADVRRARSRACLELRPTLSFDAHVDRLIDLYASR